jgi:hypothetical protein
MYFPLCESPASRVTASQRNESDDGPVSAWRRDLAGPVDQRPGPVPRPCSGCEMNSAWMSGSSTADLRLRRALTRGS